MNFWDELEIEPTREEKAIKRAYAVRLKTIDREKNPEEFQNLRHAYESALWYAKQEEIPVEEESLELDNKKIEDIKNLFDLEKILESIPFVDKAISENKIRANKISHELFLILKEKGESEVIRHWDLLEKELREGTLEFAEAVNSAFMERAEDLYYALENKNPPDFPALFLEKLFSFFDWNTGGYNQNYLISSLQQRVRARNARLELEREIQQEKRLSTILETYEAKKIGRRRTKFSTYLIQKRIDKLEQECPEIFEYELDPDTVDYWRSAPEVNGIWKYIALFVIPGFSYLAYTSTSKISKIIAGLITILLIGPTLLAFINDYLFFYEKKIDYLKINSTNEKLRALALFVFILFAAVFGLTSVNGGNLQESFFRFIGLSLLLFLFTPLIGDIISIILRLIQKLDELFKPMAPELWYIGYFVLFAWSMGIQKYGSITFEIMLVLSGLHSIVDRKDEEIFFWEIYLSLLFVPIVVYFFHSLFNLNGGSLILNSFLFIIAFLNLIASFEKYKITPPHFLMESALVVAILYCLIPNVPPGFDSMYRLYAIFILFFQYTAFSSGEGFKVFSLLVPAGIILSICLKNFWIGEPSLFPVFCQFCLILIYRINKNLGLKRILSNK